MRKALWIGSVFAVLLGAFVVVVFLVDFDSPRLGKALLDEASRARGPFPWPPAACPARRSSPPSKPSSAATT